MSANEISGRENDGSETSAGTKSQNESIEAAKLLDFIKKRTETVLEPIFQFTLDIFPVPSRLFDEFQYEAMNYDKLSKVVNNFNAQWDTIIHRLKEYENRVEKMEVTKQDVIEDIKKFLREETQNNDETLSYIQSRLNLLDESKIQTVQEELQKFNMAFTSYIEALTKKKDIIDDLPDEDFGEPVLKEIELNLQWLEKQRAEAYDVLQKIIDTHVNRIVQDTTADMKKMCKDIDIKITELEEKLRLKRLELQELRFRELKAQLSAEIATLRSRRSFIDLRLRILTDLDKSLRDLDEELRIQKENMEDTEEFFKYEVHKTMTDHETTGHEKITRIQKLKEEYEKSMEAHRLKIRKIEEEREVIKKNILDEFAIAMSKKKVFFEDENGRYYIDESGNKVYEGEEDWVFPDDIEFDFDEFGRYFIDHLGRRIYKEDDDSCAYIRDEFGNFVVVFSPKMTGFKAPERINDVEYLKDVFGDVLVKGLGQIVLYQPSDPILYLAHYILKYRKNTDIRKKREEERAALEAERERIANENRTYSSSSQKRLTSPHQILWKGGESQYDYNLMVYKTPGSALNDPSLETSRNAI